MKHDPRGPKLHIKVETFSNKIIRTYLDSGMEKGMTWEVIGSQCDKDFEIQINEWLSKYCEGHPEVFPLPLAMEHFSPFGRKIYDELRKVPFGKSLAYSELAALAGSPRAARAVGNTCGRNIFPLLIPCHRVLAQGGSLGGFSLGFDIKKTLLNHEKIKLA